MSVFTPEVVALPVFAQLLNHLTQLTRDCNHIEMEQIED